MTKPLVVYISGAPGSGKTTLARLLAEQLYVPHVSSDLIHGGVAFSNPEHDRKQTLRDVFVPTMIDMAQKGISFVADQVLQKGASEADIIDRLRQHLLGLATQHKNNLPKTAEPLKLGLPCLVVNTDNSHKPTLGEIVAFIQGHAT